MAVVTDGKFDEALEKIHDGKYDDAAYNTYSRYGTGYGISETTAVLDGTMERCEKILGASENGQNILERTGTEEWEDELTSILEIADDVLSGGGFSGLPMYWDPGLK